MKALRRTDVVTAAREMARAERLDRLSMRHLAAHLGVSPGALYYHVPSKLALEQLVVEDILTALPPPDPARATWSDLRRYGIKVHATFAQYPGLFTLLVTRRYAGPAARLAENVIAVMRRLGFSAEDAQNGLDAMVALQVGYLALLNAGRPAAAEGRFAAGLDLVLEALERRVLTPS